MYAAGLYMKKDWCWKCYLHFFWRVRDFCQRQGHMEPSQEPKSSVFRGRVAITPVMGPQKALNEQRNNP